MAGEHVDPAVHSVDLADGGSLNLILFVDGAYRMLYEKGGVSVDVPLAWLDVMAARSMFGDAVMARHGEATKAESRADEAERELRVFKAGLTDALRAHNVPATPTWADAIHWLARHGGS